MTHGKAKCSKLLKMQKKINKRVNVLITAAIEPNNTKSCPRSLELYLFAGYVVYVYKSHTSNLCKFANNAINFEMQNKKK